MIVGDARGLGPPVVRGQADGVEGRLARVERPKLVVEGQAGNDVGGARLHKALNKHTAQLVIGRKWPCLSRQRGVADRPSRARGVAGAPVPVLRAGGSQEARQY
jgi:hypothetical protein